MEGLRFALRNTNYDIFHFVTASTWLEKEHIVGDRLHGKYSDRFISSGFNTKLFSYLIDLEQHTLDQNVLSTNQNIELFNCREK